MGALAVILCSCQSDRQEDNPLPEKEELIRLFVDMHMAEIPVSRVPLSLRDSTGKVIRERIARDHDMSPEELQEIVHAVQMDFDLSTEIYDSVEVRLKRMQKTGNFTLE
jgi:hypothetical protein